MSHKRMRGFTLLELLAVITIIGILATLAAIGIANAARRARDARRQSDMIAVKQALELYQQDNGAYPGGNYAGLSTLLVSDYMAALPVDPRNSGAFVYTNSYVPDATFENFRLEVPLEYRQTRHTAPAGVTCGAAVTVKGNGVVGKVGSNPPPATVCYRATND